MRVFSRQSLNGLRLVRPSPVNPTRITLQCSMGPLRHADAMGEGSGMCGTYGPKHTAAAAVAAKIRGCADITVGRRNEAPQHSHSAANQSSKFKARSPKRCDAVLQQLLLVAAVRTSLTLLSVRFKLDWVHHEIAVYRASPYTAAANAGQAHCTGFAEDLHHVEVLPGYTEQLERL